MEDHPSLTEQMYKEIHSGNFHEEAHKYTHLKIQRTDEETEQRRSVYSETKASAHMFDGMKNYLEELHGSEIKLILNTNAFERNVVPLLEYSGIQSLFDLVATAELSKSKVEKFSLIMSRFNLNRDETVFITDSLGDVKEADMADIPTVAVTWGVHDESYFQRKKYKNLKKIAHSVDELRAFVSTYNSSHLLHPRP